MKVNYSVKAILRTDKKRLDGKCPINFRVTINSKALKLPSGEFVEESNWNKIDCCFKGAKTSVANEMLDKEVNRIKDFIREQRIFGNVLNHDTVKNFYSNKNTSDFNIVFDEFCKIKFHKDKLSLGTQKHYLLLKKRILEYKPNLKVQDIDTKFVENFDDFLRKRSVISDAGLFNRHKNLKTFVLYSIKQKLLVNNPYEDFKMPKCKEKFGHITEDELKSIRSLDLTNHNNREGLSITIDMFLFSCNTGLRCSDARNLKWSNVINMQYLSLETQKNNKTAIIPLTRLAKLTLMKYKKYKTEFVFPERTNECLNRKLKEIAKMCEINKVVTYHMSRHTFATILANNNVNPFQIAQLMTHSSMKQTMTYVNSSVNALGNSLNQISAFK